MHPTDAFFLSISKKNAKKIRQKHPNASSQLLPEQNTIQ